MKTVIPPARYLLALLLFNLAACSTMQPVALPENGYAPESVVIGSQVELLTTEGALHRFAVTEINEEGVGGEPGFFPYPEIETLQVRVAGEGTVLAAIVITVALGILFAWAIDEATKAALTPGL